MQGRDGAERYPQATDVTLEHALYRSLRTIDAAVTVAWVTDLVSLYDEHELLAARNAALVAKPASVRSFFEARLRKKIPAQPAFNGGLAPRESISARSLPDDDPYGP
jgi:hypothetical protein